MLIVRLSRVLIDLIRKGVSMGLGVGASAPRSSPRYFGFVQVLLLTMLAPKSYTSEDVIEVQCHGGGVCVQRVLACCLTAGARLAKPGEFTLRAFLNGRLDLSQVRPCCCIACPLHHAVGSTVCMP